MAIRFLQVSDVHLGSRVTLKWLSQAQRKDIVECVRESFRKAMALARERHVDLVLIPGDLFDGEAATPEVVSWAVSCIREVAPIPVLIAPGNHDPYCQTSPYHPMWADHYPDTAWPDNVHIFRSPGFTARAWGDDVCVTGIAHTRAGAITERLLSREVSRPDGRASFLMLHGSREFEGASGKEKTLPFTDAELAGQEFDWAAIGHYHSAALIQTESGRIAGGYSGCPQGRGLDECGDGYVLIGEIGGGRVDVEKVRVSSRSFWSLEVPVDGRGAPEVIAAIETGLEGARERDLVHVRLTGRAARDADFSLPGSLTSRYFAFHCDRSALEPDYDLDALAQSDGLPGRFVRRLREMSASDPSQTALYEEALMLGLDAIHGRSVGFPGAD